MCILFQISYISVSTRRQLTDSCIPVHCAQNVQSRSSAWNMAQLFLFGEFRISYTEETGENTSTTRAPWWHIECEATRCGDGFFMSLATPAPANALKQEGLQLAEASFCAQEWRGDRIWWDLTHDIRSSQIKVCLQKLRRVRCCIIQI